MTPEERKIAKQDLDLADAIRVAFSDIYVADRAGRWLEATASDSPEIRKAVGKIREILDCPAPDPFPALQAEIKARGL